MRRADFAHQADAVEGALVAGRPDVFLTVPDRVAVLPVLEDTPPGLENLRAVLLQEHEWRRAEGRA